MYSLDIYVDMGIWYVDMYMDILAISQKIKIKFLWHLF